MHSEQVMGGYRGKPDATAATIMPDGWMRPGDGSPMHADGQVHVTDRIKDMIIGGGENIDPAEIERWLAEHPSIPDAAVSGVPDERRREVRKAVVDAAPGAAVDPAEVLIDCRERLASCKRPKSGDVVAELPNKPTGKLLKRSLREPRGKARRRQIVQVRSRWPAAGAGRSIQAAGGRRTDPADRLPCPFRFTPALQPAEPARPAAGRLPPARAGASARVQPGPNSSACLSGRRGQRQLAQGATRRRRAWTVRSSLRSARTGPRRRRRRIGGRPTRRRKAGPRAPIGNA